MSWNFDEIVERIESLEDTSDLFKAQIQNLQHNIVELYADVDEYRRQSRLAKYWRQYMLDNNDSKVSPYTIGNFNDIVDLYVKTQPTITSRGVVAQTNVISDFSEENKSLQFVATEFTGDNKFPISYSYKLDLVSKVAEDVTLSYELFIGNYYFSIGTGNNWNAVTSAVSVQDKVGSYSVVPEGLYTIKGTKGNAILVGNVVMPSSDIVVTYQDKTLLFNGVPVSDQINVGTVRSGVVACKSYDQFLVQMGQKLKGIKLKSDADASSQPANKLGLRLIADSTQIGTLNPYMHFSINKVENDQVIVEDVTTFWGIAYDNSLDFQSSNKFTLYEEGVVAARLFYNPLEAKIAADSRQPIVLSNTRDSVTFAFLEEFKFSRIQQELWVTEDVMRQYRQSLTEKYEDTVITSQVLRSLALVEKLIGSVPTLEPVETVGTSPAAFIPHNLRVQTPQTLLSTRYTAGSSANPDLTVYGLPAPGVRIDNFTVALFEDSDIIVIAAGRRAYVDSQNTFTSSYTTKLVYQGQITNSEAHFEPIYGQAQMYTPYQCSAVLYLDNVYIAYKNAAGQATNTTGTLEYVLKVGTSVTKGSSNTVASSTILWNGKQYYCLSVPVNDMVVYDNVHTLQLLYESPVGDPRKERFDTAFGTTVPGNPIVHTFNQNHVGLLNPEIGQSLPITAIAYTLTVLESLDSKMYNMNDQGYAVRNFYGMGGYVQVKWNAKGSFLVYPEGSRVINGWYDDSTSSLKYATRVLQDQIDTFREDQITITQKVEWVTQAFIEFASQFQTENRTLWQRFRSLVVGIALNYLGGVAVDIFTEALTEVVTHAVTKTKFNTYTFNETIKHPSTQLQISSGKINVDKYATEHISKDMIIDSLGKSQKYKDIQSDSSKNYKNSYGKQTLDTAEQEKFRLDWATSGTSNDNVNIFPGLSADPTDIVGNRVDVIYRPLTSLPKPIGNWAHTSVTESVLEKSVDNFNTSSTRLPSHAYITAQQSYFNVSTGKPNVDRHIVGIGEANSQGKPTGDKGAGVGGVTFGFEVTHVDSNGKYVLRPKKASDFGYTDDEVFRVYGTLFGFKNIPGDATRAWNEICVSLNSKYASGTTYKTIYPSSNLISNSMYELTRNPPRWDYNLLDLNCQNFTQDVINILEGGTANHLPPNTVYNMLYLKIKGIDNALDDQTIARLIDRSAHCFYAPKRYNGCVIDEID